MKIQSSRDNFFKTSAKHFKFTFTFCCLQTKFAKVMFYVFFLCLCHFVHSGVSASVHAGIHTPEADTPQEQTSPGSKHPPPSAQCMLGDTGNKRAVRILLECIQVLKARIQPCKLTAFGVPFPGRRLVHRARFTRYVVADDVFVVFGGTLSTTRAVPRLTLHTQWNCNV